MFDDIALKNNFEEKILPAINNAALLLDFNDYLKACPDEFMLPVGIFRLVQQVYSQLAISHTESNIELVLEDETIPVKAFRYFYAGSNLYKNSVDFARANEKKLVIYGVKEYSFPTLNEAQFLEFSTAILSIRIFSNGSFIILSPMQDFRKIVQDIRMKSLQENFDDEESVYQKAFVDDQNIPNWYSSLKAIDLNTDTKKLLQNIWKKCKEYSCVAYVPEYDLDYNFNKFEKETLDDNMTNINMTQYSTIKMIKLTNDSNLFKRALIKEEI